MTTTNTISLKISGDAIEINEDIYRSLFDNSVINRYKKYENSLDKKSISFADFLDLSRKADIPYTLFLAPNSLVKKNIDKKNQKLLQGITKLTFSLNSRGSVEIKDIELIIKDLLRKQELLKTHRKTGDNKLLGCLKRSRSSISIQAETVRRLICLDNLLIRDKSKSKTLEYLVSLLEAQNVFVSQSSRTFMPQMIHNSINFSGICVRDRKYPFIFLNNKDENISFEPEGRKIFTLILLTVCIAKAKFSPISYNDQSTDLIKDDLYCITEELLMPESSVKLATINSLQDLKTQSDIFSVTPSAFLMRAQRLGLLSSVVINKYRLMLKEEFSNLPKPRAMTPKPVNGYKKYNGHAFSRAILELVNTGFITKAEARRVLTQNKQSIGFLDEYRMSL